MKVSVKVVGASGQISLGKEFAGRQVLVEETAPGDWRVRTATVVPDNERWLHEPEVAAALSRALTWAAANPARPTDLTEFQKRQEHDQERSSRKRRAKSRGGS